MSQGIRPLVTTGIALVGASVIAVSPVTVPPPEMQYAPLPAAQRVVEMSDVQLASLADDLVAIFESAIAAPSQWVADANTLVQTVRTYGELLPTLSPGEIIGAIALLADAAYSIPYSPFLNALLANMSGDPSEVDLFDAARIIAAFAAGDVLGLPTLPLEFIASVGLGSSPVDALRSIAFGYLLEPGVLGQYLVFAVANTLPAPLGGDVLSADPEEHGAVFRTFYPALADYLEFIQENVAPQQMVLAKEADVNVAPPVEDTWPPSAEEVGAAFETFGRQLEDVPEFLGTFAAEGAKAVARYLAAGRPLDAIRLVAANAIALPLELSGPPVLLGAKLLPPPVGGLPSPGNDGGVLYGGFDEAFQIGSRVINRIAPDPLETNVVEQKQIGSSGPGVLPQNSGNVLHVDLPDLNVKQKIEDGGNLIGSQKADPLSGTPGTKADDNRPKVGSNVSAVVTEVRQTVRQTVKDVRQGVRDVVKAVTGLGNETEAKQEANNENTTPNP